MRDLDHVPVRIRKCAYVPDGRRHVLRIPNEAAFRLALGRDAVDIGAFWHLDAYVREDTPIIGSGTYADETCAVSCTGHGEYFMLGVTAYDVAARMKYKGLSLENAARETIDHLTKINGEGGLIAVDVNGNVTSPFNSEGMYRGSIRSGGIINIGIYEAEPPA